MGLNKDAIASHLKYLQEDRYDREFYVALLLYDVLGLDAKELNDENIERTYKLQDEYDSIYNEDLRDRLQEELARERYEELEQEEELEK